MTVDDKGAECVGYGVAKSVSPPAPATAVNGEAKRKEKEEKARKEHEVHERKERETAEKKRREKEEKEHKERDEHEKKEKEKKEKESHEREEHDKKEKELKEREEKAKRDAEVKHDKHEVADKKHEVPAEKQHSAIVCGAASSPGSCDYQEDRWVIHAPLANDPNATLLSLYDGHGGTEAANYCVKHMHTFLTGDPAYATSKNAAFVNAYTTTDVKFLSKCEEAGCTALCALVEIRRPGGIHVTVANLGDCRCVLGIAGGGVSAVSADHKPDSPAERARIEAAGGSVLYEAGCVDGHRCKVARIDGRLACARTIGDPDFKEVPGSPTNTVSCVPDIFEIAVTPKERFLLLGCDGLFDVMTNEQVASFVHAKLDALTGTDTHMTPALAQQIAQGLVQHCVTTMGGTDNTTVVLGVFV
eukprot:TRINITY_DN2698_c0_g1_i1.p1 TRINITY_DN2698_c0_g1~~TRINITY_DN2698_c0_g1_i1.p1  ORF type:complete len:477 (-),score=152.94 TRINITY_DN2698_c0_g1_i1:47-1294(-)